MRFWYTYCHKNYYFSISRKGITVQGDQVIRLAIPVQTRELKEVEEEDGMKRRNWNRIVKGKNLKQIQRWK